MSIRTLVLSLVTLTALTGCNALSELSGSNDAAPVATASQLQGLRAQLEDRARGNPDVAAKLARADAELELTGSVSMDTYVALREELASSSYDLGVQTVDADVLALPAVDPTVELEAELADLSGHNEDLTAEIARLKRLLASASSGKDGAFREVESLQAELNAANTEARALQTQLSQTAADRDNALRAAQAEYQANVAAGARISDLETQVARIRDRLQSAQSRAEANEARVVGLQREIDRTNGQLASARAASRDADRQIAALQNQVRDLRDRLAAAQRSDRTDDRDAQAKIDKLQDKIRDLEAQLARSNSGSGSGSGSVAALERKVTELTSELASTRTELATVKGQLAAMTKERDELKAQLTVDRPARPGNRDGTTGRPLASR